jgi:hypothetical protein
MSTQNKPQMRESVGPGRRTITGPAEGTLAEEAAASAEQEAKAHKPKAAAGKQAVKPARRPARSLRAASEAKKLICRYCGSEDLAPSFVKRRDARCRACFKQRYGSAGTAKKAKRPRKAKA